MLLNDRAIEALLVTAALGTTQAAARRLHITQAAVVQRIQVLEQDLGRTLFIRSRRGMRLTPDGEKLISACHQLKDAEATFLSGLTGAKANSLVRMNIAGPTSVMRTRIIPAFMTIADRHPEVVPTFLIDNGTALQKHVESGVVDFAVVPPHQCTKELQVKLLEDEEYILVGPPRWRKRPLVDIVSHERIVDFHENDPLTLDFLKKFRLYRRIQQPRLFVNDTYLIAELVAKGLGYTVLTRGFAEAYLERGTLVDLSPRKVMRKEWCLVWNARPFMPSSFEDFVKESR